MATPFQFQPARPSVSARIPVTYTCCDCGANRLASEVRYVGPFVDPMRDPAMFRCKAECPNEDKDSK